MCFLIVEGLMVAKDLESPLYLNSGLIGNYYTPPYFYFEATS